ncbi:sulfite exporter TauE/SafE family protein [Sanguibacter suaedae]|uniref:sulfite exporter TauE/SafE family protein n=1 Tax=Sanguibacter suaedae TaxID=2795737 RepID=UPI0018E6D73B|nr:sulfite exporter TauE/SafE family protein [Sanguibacter suaedae]
MPTSLFVPADVMLLVVLALLILVSSLLQTVTGFGFAILSAPVGAALVGGPEAVGMVLVTGTAVDVLILTLRRRLPRPRWDEVGIVGVASVPGLALGAYLLATLPPCPLLLLIAATVVVAVAMRWVGLRAGHTRVVPRRWGVLAGIFSGTLGTATTLGGPPTVLYLAHRPYDPSTVRDTLVTLNLVRLPLSLVALAAGGVLVVIPGIGWLVVAALAGYLMGQRVFARLDTAGFDRVVLLVLLSAALVATAAAFLG